MKCFFKAICLGGMFFVSSTVQPVNVENYYNFVMETVIKNRPYDQENGPILQKILGLCADSGAAFEWLMNACENDMKDVPPDFIKVLHEYDFVNVTGKIDSTHDAIRALKNIALHVKEDNRLISSKKISNFIAFYNLLYIFIKSLSNKKQGPYQEKLSYFMFSFPNYHDLLQLFAESFLEKDYYFRSTTEKPFIIDCGGNLGMSILFFKMFYPTANILTFEPSQICLPFLRKNISDNKLGDITIINKALSNKKGECFFHEVPSNTLGASLGGAPNDKCTISVETVLLSEYIKSPVDFLKVDVEGAEKLIFEDLDQSGKIKLIKEMVIECHSKELLHSTLKILNKYDFIYQVKKEELWGEASLVHAFNRSTYVYYAIATQGDLLNIV